MREREVKLILAEGAQLPPPATLMGDLGAWSVDEIEQDAMYFDTSDLAMTRAGASLRYRSDAGWTVKIPSSRNGATFERDEYAFAGASGQPPVAATDLVHALTRSRTLVNVANLHTKRRRIRLHDAHGRAIIELDDDEVEAAARGRAPVRFHEVEIETIAEADPDLIDTLVDTLVDRLRRVGADTTDAMPKVARALGEEAVAPPDVVTSERLTKSATIDQFVRVTLAKSVQRLIEHDPIVRIGEDAEGVRHARAATRRLRSDLRTLRPVLQAKWSEPLRAELRWLGEQLGRVRDADVLLEKLVVKAEGLAADERAPANALIERLRETRERARDTLLDALRSERYTALLDRLVEAARAPRVRDARGSEKAAKTVGKLARRQAKRRAKLVRRLPSVPSDAELHVVRKAAKQARYALETIAPLAGSAGSGEIRAGEGERTK